MCFTIKYYIMNLRKIFSIATLMGVVILGTSCGKDNLGNDSDESVIALTVPAHAWIW